MVWSLKGFADALKTVDVKALEFHDRRGDFDAWAEHSLQDKVLSTELTKVKSAKLRGQQLRKMLVETATKRFDDLSKQTQTATRLF
jgi:hypothetical protein